MLGDYICYPKTGGCKFQIKVARDQENIFDFEFCVNKVLWLLYFAVNIFSSFFFFLIISNAG